MRSIKFALAALLGLTAMSALAQAPSPLDVTSGARAGHVPGVGDSLPKSDKASNIVPADTRSDIAPTLPQSAIGADGTPNDYLKAARASLVAGRTGQAQQSLEMAETRALDRSVLQDQASVPSNSQLITHINDARHALGGGDSVGAIAFIDLALAG
jgi:hypothetical protein